LLKLCPIKLTITQENDFRPFWNELSHEVHQFDVKRFGGMTLGTLPHHPRQGQSSAFVDHVQHQGTTASTHPTDIHDHDQRLQSQAGQEHLSIRQKIYLFLDLLIVKPSRQAFDPTFGLGSIRDLGGNAG
jgi:hypothetical protein